MARGWCSENKRRADERGHDWENPNNAVEYGPTLPPCGSVTDCVDVVQASGGHEAPVPMQEIPPQAHPATPVVTISGSGNGRQARVLGLGFEAKILPRS